MQQMKIYIDLDGVLANFEKAVVETVGVHYWDRTADKFWGELALVPNFYYNLELLPGALTMYQSILNAHGYENVEILTATPRPTAGLETAAADKTAWVRDMVDPKVTVNTVEGGVNKHRWLDEHPGTTLIDDYDFLLSA